VPCEHNRCLPSGRGMEQSLHHFLPGHLAGGLRDCSVEEVKWKLKEPCTDCKRLPRPTRERLEKPFAERYRINSVS
jgi:hypothetical protein